MFAYVHAHLLDRQTVRQSTLLIPLGGVHQGHINQHIHQWADI